MKNLKRVGWLVLLICAGAINGCYYDKYPAIAGVDFDVSLSDDLIPIFEASCNATGCHSAGGIAPDLTPANAFSELTSGGYVSTENPATSSLYRSMTGEISLMPPAGKLPDSEIALVLGWIEQGALDN